MPEALHAILEQVADWLRRAQAAGWLDASDADDYTEQRIGFANQRQIGQRAAFHPGHFGQPAAY